MSFSQSMDHVPNLPGSDSAYLAINNFGDEEGPAPLSLVDQTLTIELQSRYRTQDELDSEAEPSRVGPLRERTFVFTYQDP